MKNYEELVKELSSKIEKIDRILLYISKNKKFKHLIEGVLLVGKPKMYFIENYEKKHDKTVIEPTEDLENYEFDGFKFWEIKKWTMEIILKMI